MEDVVIEFYGKLRWYIFLMADKEAYTFSTQNGERVYFGIKGRISRKPGEQIGQQQESTID